jgi:hypothetical protein
MSESNGVVSHSTNFHTSEPTSIKVWAATQKKREKVGFSGVFFVEKRSHDDRISKKETRKSQRIAIHIPLLHIARSTLNTSIGFTYKKKRAATYHAPFSKGSTKQKWKGVWEAKIPW